MPWHRLICSGRPCQTQLYCEQSWLEHRQKKSIQPNLKSLSIVMIPFLILLFGFFFFPLLSRQPYFHQGVPFAKTTKDQNSCEKRPACFISYHDSVAVANKRWCFQYSQECCGKCQKSLNQVSDGKWDRRRKMLRLK